MPDEAPRIHPGARLAPILEAYPALEEVLFGLSPAFERLKNPVLRRTIGRVATLEQVAKVGGLDVREFVRALRVAAGQPMDPAPHSRESGGEPGGGPGSGAPADDNEFVPEWFDPARVTLRLDADAILAAGGNPLTEAFRAVGGLAAGDLLVIRASFRPEPLREALSGAGHRVFLRREEGSAFGLVVAR
jgi:hypothetical protein